MEVKKLYVSLPITGRVLNDVKLYAKVIKERWTLKGFEVITPFDVVGNENNYANCMGKDIEALLNCDGIIMCADWFCSKGCRLEYTAAEIYGLKKFHEATPYVGRFESVNK